jgi:phosphatidylglycerol lysyltransferase
MRLIAAVQRHKAWLTAAVVLLLGALLVAALRDLLAQLTYAEVAAAVRGVPAASLALAAAATAVSFAALTGYDYSSLKYVGAAVPYRLVAQTSFVAYALANTIGLGVFTGGAVRLRMYGAAGIEASVVSRAIAFNAIAFGTGIAIVGAAGLFLDAPAVASVLHFDTAALRAIAGAVLAAAVALIWLCSGPRDDSRLGRVRRRLPSAAVALRQLLFSAVDITASAAVLYVLLPPGTSGFSAFVGFYSIATALGLLSHLPGGIGIFEAIMLVALGESAPAGALAGALILYRIVYYLLPLLVAVALLAAHELERGTVAPVTRAAAALSPLLLAALTLVTGVMLLVSGVTPASDDATALLAMHVPLPLVEASHFLGSVAGLGLLFVARGMLLRLDAAWWAGLCLAGMGLIFALPKGIALSEAAVLGCLVLALAVSRREFSRKASLLAQAFTGGWLMAVAAIIAALTWLLLFAYRDVEYAHELWWQFEFDGHAPRSLRALVACALIALALALRELLRPRAPRLALPGAADIDRAASIVQAQEYADASLALMGDKHLLFSDSGRALLMYGRRSRSWIALFDPLGPRADREELVWRFIELAREQGGRPVFYQTRPEMLPVYLDAGLRAFKLGEDGFVRLPEFSLEGRRRANLRQGVARAEREGLRFELVEASDVPTVLEEMRAISTAWLAQHRAAEKGFSLGAFRDDYVRRHPFALVRRGQQCIAFATVLTTDLKVEATVDLMRHVPGIPPGTMEFLFVKLMLSLRDQGVQKFRLGMAPLSGMAEHPLAPSWHRLGRLVFAHGESFYNFRGLRSFKEKFAPEWEPRYLVSAGGLAPLLVITDVAALISGSLKGVFAK